MEYIVELTQVRGMRFLVDFKSFWVDDERGVTKFDVFVVGR